MNFLKYFFRVFFYLFKIPYRIVERRLGDLANVYADSSLAEKELNWKATRGLEEMCQDLWRWQSNNPNGFESK